jgi:hypothetical protein
MPMRQSTGKCLLCNSIFNKSGMLKHLKGCMMKNIRADKQSDSQQTRNEKFFHIVVEGYGLPEYWMHLAVSDNTTLKKLDQFLRDIWLECCGHLSAFEIEKVRYSSSPMTEYNEKNMHIKIGELLRPRITFSHEYDFGSTTMLRLTVLIEQTDEIKANPIQILARNEPLEIKCDNCGNIAAYVCSECGYSGKGWICEECSHSHECGEEMLLPVVNSPRVGVCGYTG